MKNEKNQILAKKMSFKICRVILSMVQGNLFIKKIVSSVELAHSSKNILSLASKDFSCCEVLITIVVYSNQLNKFDCFEGFKILCF